jgi:hypothetical protein
VTEEQAQDLEDYDDGAFRFVKLWLIAFTILFVIGLLISGCHSAAKQRQATHDTKPLVAQRYDYWIGRD